MSWKPKEIRPPKKRSGGIWVSNKFDKPKDSWRKKDGGRIKPAFKYCIICKKRKVRFHHALCESCWKEQNYNSK